MFAAMPYGAKLADCGTARGSIVENFEMLGFGSMASGSNPLRHRPAKILCEHIAVQDCLRKIQERRENLFAANPPIQFEP